LALSPPPPPPLYPAPFPPVCSSPEAPPLSNTDAVIPCLAVKVENVLSVTAPPTTTG